MEQKTADQLVKEIFPGYKGAGEIYSEFLDQHLKSGDKILNAGCGAQAIAEKFFIRASEVIGIDKIEPNRVPSYLDQFIRADLIRLPLPDNYFDIIIAEWVLEHLQKPKVVLNEFKRILKPGGKIIFMTTNISSFLGILSLLTPTFIHKKLKRICLGIKEGQTFPTKYRINTSKRIDKIFRESGFIKIDQKTADALGYWQFNKTLLRWVARKAQIRAEKEQYQHRFHIIGVYQVK